MLDAPETRYAPEQAVPRRTSAAPSRRVRRDFSEDFAADLDDDVDGAAVRRQGGVRLSFRGGLPRTKWGRAGLGLGLLALLGLGVAGLMAVRGMVLRDDRFVIQSSSSIAVEGNQHLTKAQLLSIFGEDVERNVFTVSLAERKTDLERLPWVQHATVMRLLPNHIRVSVAERTPVAFVRQGNQIGLVDKGGVLLDMAGDSLEKEHYSFPVVTGLASDDPLSTRAARMKIYERFTAELDASGDKISQTLSEVDLSNPEDVKALIPDTNADILVHFGDTDYLGRYQKYKAHLAEWRTQYPKLSSVDMRYDRQVVLEMQPGSTVPLAGVDAANAAAAADRNTAGGAKTAGTAKLKTTPVAKAAGLARLKAAPVAKVVTVGRPALHPAAATRATSFAGSPAGAKADSSVGGKAPAVTSASRETGAGAQAHWVPQSKPSPKRVVAKRQAVKKKVVKKRPAAIANAKQNHPATVGH